MKDLEEILKKELDCKVMKPFGHGSGEFFSYDTDKYGKVFVKLSSNADIARPMFEAEMASLNLLRELNLPNVTIAKPYKIIDLPYMRGGACLVLDYLFTESLYSNELQAKIGTAVAHMHLHNIRMKKENPDKYVDKFGFNMSTYCGRIPQDNEWKKEWLKLGHEEAAHLWDLKIKPNLHKLFENVSVEPSLLHGDLWAGNVGMKVDESEAYMYDPAVFYGHHEYDLAISSMFPGFRQQFYDAYHALIPKAPGFEDRQRVYQLFHYLNHWNHFGGGYKSSSLSIMRNLASMLKA
uniref:protein-ribulosamine 3-kinase n=1 Tax=Cacopsylla melanoneura TaxID=428564 RepID=A0A8D8Y857_9HEMI